MKKTGSRILIVLMAMFAASMLFAACAGKDKEPEQVTVTFVANEQTVKTVTVDKGSALAAADIPADPESADYDFEGWYIGETAFTGAETYDVDTTVTAKLTRLYTVSFVVNDETIKTVKVRDGEKIAQNDIPEETMFGDYALVEWKVGGESYDSDAAVTGDITAVAELERVVFNVSFVVDGTTQTVKTDDSGYLAKDQVPAVTAPEGKLFLGWADSEGQEKVFGIETVISEDTTFTAKFIEEDFIFSTWISEDYNTEIVLTQNSVKENGVILSSITPNINGLKAEWRVGSGEGAKFYILEIGFDETATLDYRYADAESGKPAIKLNAFQFGNTSEFAGMYTGAYNDKVELNENGTIGVFCYDSTTYASYLQIEGNQVTIRYTGSNSVNRYVGTLDGKKLVLTGGKEGQTAKTICFYRATAADRVDYSTNYGSQHIYVFEQGTENETVLYYESPDVSGFVSADMAVTENAVVTFTQADETKFMVRFESDRKFRLRDVLVGTYTSEGQPDLEIDGFGAAKLDGKNYTYRYHEQRVVLFDAEGMVYGGYEVDGARMKYAEIESDIYAGKYNYGNYSLVLNGYGFASSYYAANVRASGYYSLTEKGIALDIDDTMVAGELIAYQSGKVLVHGSYVYSLDGYTVVEPDATVYQGAWSGTEQDLIVDPERHLLHYNGISVQFDLDYDNGLHFTIGENLYFATLTENKLNLKLGSESVELVKTGDSFVFPEIIPDAHLYGALTASYYMSMYSYGDLRFVIAKNGLIEIDKFDGNLHSHYEAYANYDAAANKLDIINRDVTGDRYELSYQNGAYSLIYTSNDVFRFESDKISRTIALEENWAGVYEGTLEGGAFSGEQVIQISADGTLRFGAGYNAFNLRRFFSPNTDTMVWEGVYDKVTLVDLHDGTLSVTYIDSDDNRTTTGTVTLKKEAVPTQMAGNWEGTAVGGGNITLSLKEDGSGEYNGVAFTEAYYNSGSEKVIAKVGDEVLTIELIDGDKLKVVSERSGSVTEVDLTRKVEAMPDWAIGDWIVKYLDDDGFLTVLNMTIASDRILIEGQTVTAYQYTSTSKTLIFEYEVYKRCRITLTFMDDAYQLIQEAYSIYTESWYEDWAAESVEKQITYPEWIVGTWSGKVGANTVTVVVKVDGSVTINGDAYADGKYDAASKKLTVPSFGDEGLTLTYVNDTKAHVAYELDYEPYSGDLTKAAELPEWIVGTWSGKVGANTCTVIVKADGSVTINGDAYADGKYDAASKKLTVPSFGDEGLTLTYVNDTKAHVAYELDYEPYSGDLTKS